MEAESASKAAGAETEEAPGLVRALFEEIVYSPVNLLLSAIILVLAYKIYRSKYSGVRVESAPAPPLARLPRRDYTPAELRAHDGAQADGRVLVAVNGFVFDVTRGRRFYGPGGPYSAFGGRDASRGLATFSVTSSETEYDDLSDLNSMEMESVKEWETQFREKYDLVGRLLKPGEEPTTYSDEETEDTEASSNTTEKQSEAKKDL